MTRINTNVPSLVAQNRLQTSNKDLQSALTRLSTGLRINKGSDDPAGLIASESLRSEITSINKAIGNTQRATQIVNTADSALGQVSSLLNDIKGLVVEAANSGGLSNDEIAANQLQVDSSLEAINRISQTTTFQGRKLLDGSLDFLTTAGVGSSNINNLLINQANLGATGSVAVTINVATAATKAAVDITGFTAAVAGTAAASTVTFGSAGNTAAFTLTQTTPNSSQNTKTFTVVEAAGVGTTPVAADDGSGNITLTVDDTGTTTLAAIQTALGGLTGFSVARVDAGTPVSYVGASTTPPSAGTFTGGVTAIPAGNKADTVFELAGKNGSQVFNITAGTSLAQVISQINLVTDATGITAASSGTTLQLRSSDYGTDAAVDLRILTQGAGGNFGSSTRATGTDVIATVNGRSASASGNKLSITTGTLDVSADVAAAFTGNASFTINGGGAQFQLGPNVVSNQQARLGISSVNSARLGGLSGKLFQLGSGETASLSHDATLASKIVTEAINQVTSLRGRLGAFQSTTLNSNLASLNDTGANLQEAQSAIRDADFAKESANLTRAQILVQSGTKVLALANQNPQTVLSLLQ